jgi:hypothetical protein
VFGGSPYLESLSSLESTVLASLGFAAIAVALWSAGRGVTAKGPDAGTGELTWSLVAATVLLAVCVAVWSGGQHAG